MVLVVEGKGLAFGARNLDCWQLGFFGVAQVAQRVQVPYYYIRN